MRTRVRVPRPQVQVRCGVSRTLGILVLGRWIPGACWLGAQSTWQISRLVGDHVTNKTWKVPEEQQWRWSSVSSRIYTVMYLHITHAPLPHTFICISPRCSWAAEGCCRCQKPPHLLQSLGPASQSPRCSSAGLRKRHVGHSGRPAQPHSRTAAAWPYFTFMPAQLPPAF